MFAVLSRGRESSSSEQQKEERLLVNETAQGFPTRQEVELCRPRDFSVSYLPNPLLGKKNVLIKGFLLNILTFSVVLASGGQTHEDFYPTPELCTAV